jgi:hypothetical protein
MMYRLAICLVLASLTFVPAKRAAADTSIQAVFDTVDSVEIKNADNSSSINHAIVLVRGVLAGGSTPNTQSFDFGNNVGMAMRCERLAVIAMSKSGKFQFAIGADPFTGGSGQNGHGDCKLILVTP